MKTQQNKQKRSNGEKEGQKRGRKRERERGRNKERESVTIVRILYKFKVVNEFTHIIYKMFIKMKFL